MLPITKVDTSSLTNAEFFVQKTQNLVLMTTRIALQTLILNHSKSARDFYDGIIQPKLNEITELDERSQTFFSKMMAPVTSGFDALPGMENGFHRFQTELGIPNIKAKYLEAIALDPIKALIIELDDRNPSIIDDVNAS
ncbi:MAG: hypothetical protein K940chlam3_00634 [Chlamydiae bacterium]|nr:hypothetical protein [Chlamydiota bacterium]